MNRVRRLKLAAIVAALSLVITVGCNTSWVDEAVNILKVAAPAALNVLQLVSAFTSRPVDPAQSATIANDINAAEKLLTDYSAASAAAKPTIVGQLSAVLATTQTDLRAILATARVVNPQKQAQVTALVNFIVTELASIESLLPPSGTAAAAPGPGPATNPQLPMTAKQFKASFNRMIGDPNLTVK